MRWLVPVLAVAMGVTGCSGAKNGPPANSASAPKAPGTPTLTIRPDGDTEIKPDL